ncbi:OTU domain-containing protein [Schistosoma japonicum]|uniref:OTU domain-containing protein n=1 Tax=Schistosoma japonicum TaxID=6182 RepID=A0A4Z2DY31_SCHJA|nr:OTU domain-containing protein [Schistosoma japonicum]TNN21328.1 OTU domain-containing protein [Schistosoma japonicum]
MGSKSRSERNHKTSKKDSVHIKIQQDRSSKVCFKGNDEDDYYLKNDPSAPEFREQLNQLGLDFREVPSDGNCLFSSLSDQLYGTTVNHKEVREQAVLYIEKHKEEFEPFFDVKDKLNKLRLLGTYGGHECIIAVSRYFSVSIIIHQLKQKPWLAGIPVIDKAHPKVATYRQLHLAYHNGEHYSSVRVFGDNSNNPTKIKICLSTENASPPTEIKNYKKCVDYLSDGSDDNSSVYSFGNCDRQSIKVANCNSDYFHTFPFGRKLSKKEKRYLKRRFLELSNSEFVIESISALHM